ncbi:DNA polymerase lambda-like [Thrips palmi]|uniref:DNA polymerase n=1 Tax=Thrips palmi TaxID=161013 RepID=A0A6P8Y6Q3_THRPL|nr:DNA polymerase lambda-like [Thrips palmi]
MNKQVTAKEPTKASLFSKNLSIFVLPILIGKKRLSLFESQILKGGGKVCSLSQVKSGEANPTLIVVEDSLLQNSKILEQHLKAYKNMGSCTVVGTKWLSDSIKFHKCMSFENYKPHNQPSYDEDCLPPKKQKLSEQGRENLSNNFALSEPSCSKETIEVEKFACSQSSSVNTSLEENKIVIQELQKLADAFRIKGDTWRSHGYTKAISAIKRCGKVLSSYEDAVSLPGVGDKIASKVWEILETGRLRKVSEVCEDSKTKVLQLFTNIWGVGPSTAEAWYLQGFCTLDDLKEKGTLTKQQQIGLKYYQDFLERIPRIEVEEIGELVSVMAKSIQPQLTATLVGSYRRGKESCGDIDVMICKPDHLDSKNILSQLLESLKNSGLITDDLVSIEKDGNERKYLGVCQLPGENKKHRRLDIFLVQKSELGPALMHYTGSALFNRSIRLLAAKKGMSLSEHSLHGGIVREGLKVLNGGYIIPTPDEKSIFEALGLAYRPPEERDH